MKKRFLSIVIIGVLFSPSVMAVGQSTTLYENHDARDTALGEVALDETPAPSTQCIYDQNPHRESLASAGAAGSSYGAGVGI